MKITWLPQCNNTKISFQTPKKNENNSSCTNSLTLSNNSINEIYFKGLLAKKYTRENITNILEKNGYIHPQDIFSKNISDQMSDNLTYTIEDLDNNSENAVKFVKFIGENKFWRKTNFPCSTTYIELNQTPLSSKDIDDLTNFANLAQGKIGKYLETDFEYTFMIFMLMKQNDIYDRFISNIEKQPEILNLAMDLFEHKQNWTNIKSINRYKSLSGFAINQVLRELATNKNVDPSNYLSDIQILDKCIENYTIKNPIKLIRSDHLGILSNIPNDYVKSLINECFKAYKKNDIEKQKDICKKLQDENLEIIVPGYLSTSIDIDLNRDIIWHLNIMPGVKGAYIDLLNFLKKETAQENEILLQRNCRLKTTNWEINKNGQISINANVYPN